MSIQARSTMSTAALTTTTTETTNWKAGLPVLTSSTLRLRELRIDDAASLLAMLKSALPRVPAVSVKLVPMALTPSSSSALPVFVTSSPVPSSGA